MTPTQTNIVKTGNKKWLNEDVQARIDPPPIPLIKATNRNTEETNIIKVKIRQDPASATSETYELKVQTFKNGKPEEFLQMMKDFKTAVDGTGTNTILHGEALREFDAITGQVRSTNNTHLKKIKEGLLSYFPPLNAPNK